MLDIDRLKGALEGIDIKMSVREVEYDFPDIAMEIQEASLPVVDALIDEEIDYEVTFGKPLTGFNDFFEAVGDIPLDSLLNVYEKLVA